MVGEMGFSYKDLYPNYGGVETSTQALPDEDDMDALAENADDAEEATSGARPKNLIIAAIVMIAVVVWLGGAK